MRNLLLSPSSGTSHLFWFWSMYHCMGFRTSKVQSRKPCSWSQQQPLCGWLHSNRQDQETDLCETDLCVRTRRLWHMTTRTVDLLDMYPGIISTLKRKTARLSCRWQWQSRQPCWLWHLEKETQLESVQVKMEGPEQVLISRAGEEWGSEDFGSQLPTASARIPGERATPSVSSQQRQREATEEAQA